MSSQFNPGRPAVILLVEDNENDMILTREGFKRAKLHINLQHVVDGEECMAFLRKQGKYADAPTPDLILLDLNLPRKDGREVMAEILADDTLKSLPVVVLTTSDDAIDVERMYGLRCSSYIVKPVDFDQFVGVVRSIGDYWLTVVVLPNHPPDPHV